MSYLLSKALQLRSLLRLTFIQVCEQFFVLMWLKTFATEAVAPPWFAPIQQQLNNFGLELNNICNEQRLDNIEQRLHRADTKASRVCPHPFLLTLP